jgi:hypothetical protein
MPHRLVSIAILVVWSLSAVGLLHRDILPDLIIGPPPDLRSLSRAGGADASPTRWALLAADSPTSKAYHPVGQVVTRQLRRRDGTVQWSSQAKFDATELTGRKARSTDPPTPLAQVGDAPAEEQFLEVISLFEIDPSGNLFHFRAAVRAQGLQAEMVVLEGHQLQNELEVTVHSPLPLLNSTRRFPYQARGMVQDALAPIDRMPGLQVGQRWESRVVSPLTGRVQEVHSEVVDREVLHWGKGPVNALIVETRMPASALMPPLSFRTWVRPDDGLVLRQEVPYPLVHLVLERQADDLPPQGPAR